MKRIIISIAALIIFSLGGYYAYNEFYKQPAQRHIHAGFIVFDEGKQVGFSNVRYMSLKPCEEDGGRKSKKEIDHEKAHLHDNIGFVAHSHREEAVWADLFRNVNYQFDSSKPLVAFVNGKQIEDILSYPVNPYDSVVILIGNSDKKLASKAISKEQMVQVEKTSMDCGT